MNDSLRTPNLKTTRRMFAVAGLLAGALCLPAAAQASPIIGFGIADGPVIDIQSLLVAYDTESESLFVVDLNSDGMIDSGGDGTLLSIDGTGFNVILSIDGTGRLNGGSLELQGTVEELGFMSGTLLTAEAMDFGFFEGEGGGGSDELQLVFSITGGDAAALFGPSVALSLGGSGFVGDFAADFVNDGSGSALVGNPVPLPGALWFLASALAFLGMRRSQLA